jgi:DNA-binding response OmpR family regulator
MNKKILVVDDDEAVLEMLEAVLDYSGFGVKGCKAADTIFDDIEDYKPDLILIDYILNGINGGEICHQIKTNSKTQNLPVVLISAYPRVLQSLGSYGCDTFIAKPFDITYLVDNINYCLEAVN